MNKFKIQWEKYSELLVKFGRSISTVQKDYDQLIGTRKTALEDVIEALGGKVIKSSGRGKCCGFPILTSNEANSLQMCGDHTIDAKEKGAVTLVTPCPLCHLELDGKQADAAAYRGEDINMPVLHLPQLIGLALGFTAKEMAMQRHLVSTGAVEDALGFEVKA